MYLPECAVFAPSAGACFTSGLHVHDLSKYFSMVGSVPLTNHDFDIGCCLNGPAIALKLNAHPVALAIYIYVPSVCGEIVLRWGSPSMSIWLATLTPSVLVFVE